MVSCVFWFARCDDCDRHPPAHEQGKDLAPIIPISSLSEDELAIMRRKTVGLKDI